ncbi:hypothetical protein [Alloscardovia macacae]|uniref:hypothetical protein n=1 Tax=Alloscardovia macacae TaxID=1160091 RepID=UPI001B8088DB|nr:hypothetical protein [Alloscardovia macacae]
MTEFPAYPHIRDHHGHPTLFVHNEPFFAYAGEVHNSSSSDLAYMEQTVWPRA